MNKQKPYYIGLDCGTSSVGWAVTDENYHLLRRKGKTLWGVRLFDEAQPAADRRTARSSRRRLARRKRRIKLLQNLFRTEIDKIDSNFYTRLRESFFREEDKLFSIQPEKDGVALSKNALFNDKNFSDRDFHQEYPTIWHLRNAIIRSVNDQNKHFDIRLYYLAIEHILKHRGHFLREGELHGAGNFSDLWKEFLVALDKFSLAVDPAKQAELESLLKDKRTSKIDKKKQLAKLILTHDEVETDKTSKLMSVNDAPAGGIKELSTLLVGGKANLAKLFNVDVDKDEEKNLKLSFVEDNFEEKLPNLEPFLNSIDGALDLVLICKQIYDYVYLSNLLRTDGADDESGTLSASMVRNYNQHKKDLGQIKSALKPFPEDYRYFFKTEGTKDKTVKTGNIFYAAYIGVAYTKDNNGRKSPYSVSQVDLNKELLTIFTRHNISGKLLQKAENGELLPKQRGFAKGTIPEQLHHNELKLILAKLAQDYPSFAEPVLDEPEEYDTALKKIELLHNFRIPYYCGPMLSKTEKNTIFSWAKSIDEEIYPWNYAEKVNISARADAFIQHMTNECTYVASAKVLPKHSFLYEKYLVLNELNNLKINGKRIDQELKSKIYQLGFLSGELSGNITLNRLSSWLKTRTLIGKDDELGGTNEVKNLPRLTSHIDFSRILGEAYRNRYTSEQLELAVRYITILGNEPKMLAEKLRELLNCSEARANRLSRLPYKDWGRLSREFLTEVFAEINGRRMSILEALEETSYNLMELLGGDFSFKNALDKKNKTVTTRIGAEISYSDVQNLYCSPAVKRSVWQTIKIVQELERVMGYSPEKIFLEVTRGEEKGNKKAKLSRRKDLIGKYEKIKTEEAQALLGHLEGEHDDRDLQSKKLFLYYQQMGKCAYCGHPISLEEINNHELCDIDHIFPRSKTKDDSITNNLVLVHAEENRDKTNIYPVSGVIRIRMRGIWSYWLSQGLISKEKYNRLTRVSPLSLDELAGFISRQIVETSQSVKSIRDLLSRHLPKTKIVLVKASNVSDLRHCYSQGEPRYSIPQMPEFIKIRELNDFHHAKDAYLNVVVGNVLSGTFTDNPYKWLQRKQNKGELDKYSIRSELLLRGSEAYRNKNGEEHRYPFTKNWNYADSLKIVSDAMRRNDILWTKMPYEQSGAISDLQIVGKGNRNDELLPIKQDARLKKTDKYGGYNKPSGAYFMLVEEKDGTRRIVPIPIIAKDNPEKYLKTKYPGAKIIIPKIKFKTYLKINGFPCHLAGRTGKSLLTHGAVQLIIPSSYFLPLKNILKLVSKIKQDKNYLPNEHDGVTKEGNQEMFKLILDKLGAYREMPEFSNKIPEIQNTYDEFLRLNIQEQGIFISELLKILRCNAEKGNLSLLVNQASVVGLSRVPMSLSEDNEYLFILQSPTGLFERKIDLKTVKPGEVK